MVFQGAPGAGKSALMLECMEAVRRHSTPGDPWVAVAIYPETLMSSVDVALGIVAAVNEESARLSETASGPAGSGLRRLLGLGAGLIEELSERGVALGGVSVGGKPADSGASAQTVSAQRVFREAAPLLGKVRVAVFVDEAQNIPVTEPTKGVVACLHSPPGRIPLVTAFFGLSDTRRVLRDCGLSRFARGRTCNLEPLSTEDATASLRRMLDAYYAGADGEKAVWASALAELSQGWPQHMNCVGVEAGRVIRASGGRVERHLLERALEHGVEGKNEYYEGRVEAGSGRPWVYRRLAEAAAKKAGAMSEALSYDEVRILTESARRQSDESMDEFLTNALHAGLLAPAPRMPDYYKIPIPSLGDYLRPMHTRQPHAD